MNAHTQPPEYLRTFDTISALLQASIGHRLFTVSRVLPEQQEVERIYSSRPHEYPVTGRKPVDQTEWRALMERGECFVANHPKDFGEHFTDLDAIVAQGLGSVINMPVIDNGHFFGTLNLLHTQGAYPDAPGAIRACTAVHATALQAYRQYDAFLQRPAV